MQTGNIYLINNNTVTWLATLQTGDNTLETNENFPSYYSFTSILFYSFVQASCICWYSICIFFFLISTFKNETYTLKDKI